jgi:hypothetical protein
VTNPKPKKYKNPQKRANEIRYDAPMKLLLTLFFFVIASTSLAQATLYQRFFYLGTVGEDTVQLELTLNDTDAVGTYYYDLIGIPIALRGSQLGEATDTGQPYLLEELDADGKPVATFKGELSATSLEFGSMFTGEWTGDNGVKLPFTLERVAEFAKVTFQQNRIETSLRYPVFRGKLADFNNTVNQNEQISDLLKDFEQGQDIQRDNELFHAWTIYVDHDITYASERLLSMLVTAESYTGGAHGNIGFGNSTFLKEADGVRELGLRDLFVEDADLKNVLELLTDDLTQQDATFIVDGSTILDEDTISVFTLSPKGITFHFAPYVVGPYAQGPLESTVAFEDVKDILRPEILAEFKVQ